MILDNYYWLDSGWLKCVFFDENISMVCCLFLFVFSFHQDEMNVKTVWLNVSNGCGGFTIEFRLDFKKIVDGAYAEMFAYICSLQKYSDCEYKMKN